MTADGPEPALRDALKDAIPRVVAALTRRFGDFAAAEDAAQDALLAALVAWRRDEMPANPGGWLYTTALRRMADHHDAEAARRRREEVVAKARPEAEEAAVLDDPPPLDGDETLTLMFLCCHPALTPPSAIALTLRAVGGLTTAEIAGALLVPEATTAQRISRAKRSIAEAGAQFVMPDAAERAKRLPSVLHAIYLVFNEGYATQSGERLLRVELSNEAIRLARILDRSMPDEPEVAGLLALMLLTDARRPARASPEGELIPLHEQDRGRWDRTLIDEGTRLVSTSLGRGAVGAYQIQAAISALHDEATSVATTDWPQILALYGLLARMSDNPMVALSRVVAGAMVHGPATGLVWLRELEADPRLERGHRVLAVRAHLLEMSGDVEAAAIAYREAAAATASAPERRYLRRKAAQEGRGSSLPSPGVPRRGDGDEPAR